MPSPMSSYALLCGQTVMRGSGQAVNLMGLVGGVENCLKRHSGGLGWRAWCRQIPRKQVFLGSAWSVNEQDDAGSMVCLLGETESGRQRHGVSSNDKNQIPPYP